MNKLLPIAVLGILALTGCSNKASDSGQAAQAPAPPPAVKTMPANAQSAIAGAIPAGDMSKVQPKAQ